MNKKYITNSGIIVIIIAAIVYLEAGKPRRAPGSAQDVVVNYATSTDTSALLREAAQYGKAKEITDPTGFINSPNGTTSAPFTLSQFAGNKVVLLDFWTYSCINCERTIPYLNAWYQKYKDYGLEIVGVHSPEFDFEKQYSNVAAAVKQYGIQYPIVLDSDMGTWHAYNNQYWPAEYLINVDGFVVHQGIGEGNYAETEEAIQAALKQRDQVLGLPDNVPTGLVNPADAVSVDASNVDSPETYFGASRNEYLANGNQGVLGTQTFAVPNVTQIKPNGLYLSGVWNFEGEYAENTDMASKIFYNYSSKNVYFVAAANTTIAPQGVKVRVIVDGILQKTVTIEANMLYSIVEGAGYGEHKLELDIEGPGLDAYTFTFG